MGVPVGVGVGVPLGVGVGVPLGVGVGVGAALIVTASLSADVMPDEEMHILIDSAAEYCIAV